MRVLIATDGSECSYKAVREFLRLMRPVEFHVYLLSVMPLMTVGVDTAFLQVEMEREGLSAIHGVRSILDGFSAPVEVELREGIPADAIIEMAHEKKVDLIVIGHHGRMGSQEQLLGSTTKSVVQRAPCTVLVGR
jgi:nucleotide-binding universal stress UspA family protein